MEHKFLTIGEPLHATTISSGWSLWTTAKPQLPSHLDGRNNNEKKNQRELLKKWKIIEWKIKLEMIIKERIINKTIKKIEERIM